MHLKSRTAGVVMRVLRCECGGRRRRHGRRCHLSKKTRDSFPEDRDEVSEQVRWVNRLRTVTHLALSPSPVSPSLTF